MKHLYIFLSLILFAFNAKAADTDLFQLVDITPADGETVATIPADGRITFDTSDNAAVATVNGVIVDHFDSNGVEEQYGSFTTKLKDEQGKPYWLNDGPVIYFLQGHTYYLTYTFLDAEGKRLASGTVAYKGGTDPDSLIDYTFAPIKSTITYTGTEEEISEVEVMFEFDENVYVNFNGYISIKLYNEQGKSVPATFLARSSMSKPLFTGFAIRLAKSQTWNFDETYTVKIPTMFGDAEWFGVTGNDKYFTGKANAPMDFSINLAKDGVSSVNTIATEAMNQPVYNLQGIKVADSTANLPAGLYICSGKKIAIRR